MFSLVPPAYAASFSSAGCTSDGVATITGINCLLENIISPLPSLIILIAIGMIIFAGIKFMNAGSDPKAFASAMQTFTWAIIGIILLSGAWLILVLVQNLTGAKVTQFGI